MSTLSIVAIIYVNNCIHMGFIAFWNLLINFCSVLFCSIKDEKRLDPLSRFYLYFFSSRNEQCNGHLQYDPETLERISPWSARMREVFQPMKSFVTTGCRMFVAPEKSLLD